MNEPTKSLTNHMNELKENLYSTVKVTVSDFGD